MTKILLSFLLSGFCAIVCSPVSGQQPPAETSPSADGGKAPGRLRAWVFPGKQGGSSTLTIGATGTDGSWISLATAVSQATGSAYRDVPQSAYTFAIKDGEKIVAQKQAQVASDSFYTLAAWLKDGKWSLEVYPDSAAPGGSGQRALRLLNFAGAATTTVLVGSARTPVKVVPDSIQEVKLPAKITPLEVSVQPTGGGAPARTLSEVDLAVAPAAYVLVSPDYRGRLRPSIIPAGEPAPPVE